ncbi:DNA mismatch repair protein MutS [Akkermansia sp.]|uniref:DNA mismatch repair protein MutS n=1 Tax=Akkermansia sp. TaxID=1872421 RepID=UPI003AB5F87F
MSNSGPTSTPMMDQYLRMKKGLPEDVLLFFRLGDFYEMFFEDAKEASSILGLTLTKRHGIPMCGVPHHSAEGYIGRLVKGGKRVAIAEQTTIPQPGKLVERELTRVISAGTLADMNLLDSSRHNYIVALYKDKKHFGLACVDHTTGEFSVAQFEHMDLLLDELSRINPSELLISDEQTDCFPGAHPTLYYDGYTFLPSTAIPNLLSHFRVHSLDGFGCGEMTAALGASGAVLHYLGYQLRRPTDHLRRISVRATESAVLIDQASQRNLDLVDSRGGVKLSLLGTLDRTSTPMGARKLRDWLLHPLCDLEKLQARQEMISVLLQEPYLMSKLRESLKNVRDMERLTGRISQGAGNARDLQALASSLGRIPALRDDLESLPGGGEMLESIRSRMGCFDELVDLLQRALVDEPPVTIKEGGIIREGYHAGLDELRLASRDGKEWLAQLQEKERRRTGIDSLKIRFNNVFGYYIEVTKSHYDKVPPDYQRKQTLVNAERFVTPELKQMENTILGADERSRQVEYEQFLLLREEVGRHIDGIQITADAMADLDVLLGLAEGAQQYQYCRPVLDNSMTLRIVNGRHPVIEQNVSGDVFVPNDAFLEPEENRLILLTGPNMAGKSTYIRQVALITLMAQIGAYVPAESAHIGLVDRIFCRVGASDDLARGQSTFMVEMSETSLILNNATERSLIILDEIGRGTATFDGLSIAWAVAEYLHDELKSRTLFATHYHELTDLARSRAGVQNYNVAVREWKEEIVFLRKIVQGAADKSYGIQVARLAGMPAAIVDRAKAILSHLEMNSTRPRKKECARLAEPRAKNTDMDDDMPTGEYAQLELF